MPGKNQKYGEHYTTLTVALDPEEHRQAKIKAATLQVPIADVVRLALADDNLWKEAQRLKAKEKGGQE